MLVYDNRGRLRLICQLYGSIYRRVWIPAILVSLYTVTLHLVFWHLGEEYRPTLDHPFAAQSLAVLVSFSVCFRTNIAWSRFWEACREVTFMYSKWGDANSQLQGFISSTIKHRADSMSEEDMDRLEYYRAEVTHYFSLLSCMAVERLMRGDIRRMQLRREHGASWYDQVVFREHLRFHDLTGSKQLCKMREIRLQELLPVTGPETSGDRVSQHIEAGPKGARRRQVARSSSVVMMKLQKLGKTQGVRRAAISIRRSPSSEDLPEDDWDHPLPVIGELSREELRRLKASEDRTSLVISWINQLVTDAAQHLCVPAPILSRVYQEISNGALGYSQAEKLADIPFPFIFAQLLAIALLLVAFISPVAFSIITGNSSLTPLISSSTVLSFWSLNEMSKELENPFGVEANNVALVDNHERFVQGLGEIHGTQLPSDRAHMPTRRSRLSTSPVCQSSSFRGSTTQPEPPSKTSDSSFVVRRPPGLVAKHTKDSPITRVASESSEEEPSVRGDGSLQVEEPSPLMKPASEAEDGSHLTPHLPTSVCPTAWSKGGLEVASVRGSLRGLEVS